MKRMGMVAAAMVFMCGPVAAQDATSQLMTAAAGKANVLAQISYEYVRDASQPVPSQKYTAQAICIDKEKGLFMTYGIVAGMRSSEINDLRLSSPGDSGATLKAEFLWTDRETNISFLRATEPGDFIAVGFNTKADLKIGAKVVSVGMFEDDPAHSPYVSVGYISSVMQIPGKIVLVASGMLTNDGSPVMNEAGEFIGVTMSQFLRYQVRTNQGVQEMALDSKAMGHFFRPAGEFTHVLDYVKATPNKPRVLSWIGVLNFREVDDSGVIKADVPAVVVGRVVADGPAAAVLKENDLIVAINGQGLEKFSSPVLTRNAFALKLIRMAPGQPVKLTIRRDGKQSDVQVVTAAQPQDDSQTPQFIVTQLGFRVRERAELDKYLMPKEMAQVPGLVVIQVGPNTSADRANLRGGDIITSVNNEPVTKMAEFKSKVTTALTKNPGSAVVVGIQRVDEKKDLLLQPPVGQ